MRSCAPPSASSTVRRDSPNPVSAKQPRQRRRALAVRGQRQDARLRMQMRADAVERAAVQRDQRGLGQRPAEPRRREAERRRRRHDQHLVAARHGSPAPSRRHGRTDRRRRARRPAARARSSTASTAARERATARAAPRRGSAAPASARWRSPPNTISALGDQAARARAQARPRRPRRCRRWTASASMRQVRGMTGSARIKTYPHSRRHGRGAGSSLKRWPAAPISP